MKWLFRPAFDAIGWIESSDGFWLGMYNKVVFRLSKKGGQSNVLMTDDCNPRPSAGMAFLGRQWRTSPRRLRSKISQQKTGWNNWFPSVLAQPGLKGIQDLECSKANQFPAWWYLCTVSHLGSPKKEVGIASAHWRAIWVKMRGEYRDRVHRRDL